MIERYSGHWDIGSGFGSRFQERKRWRRCEGKKEVKYVEGILGESEIY